MIFLLRMMLSFLELRQVPEFIRVMNSGAFESIENVTLSDDCDRLD